MTGPTLQYIEVSPDGMIFAQFDQPVYFDGGTLDGFTILVNGVPVAVNGTWGGSGDNRLGIFTTPAINQGDSVQVSYAGSDLHNSSGDPVQAFSENSLMNNARSAPVPTGPTLQYIEVSPDGMIFAQFDQPVYFDGGTLDGFTILVNGIPVAVNGTWGASGDNRLGIFTTPDINQGDSVQVSYAGSDLHNSSGDPVQAFSENSLMNMSNLLCFLINTRIQTVGDEVEVEVQALKIGNLLINNAGQEVLVKWIGKQRFNPRFGKENLPICISSGALGNGLPVRDLYVSPDHAMYIDNCVLVHAKALVNGTSIYQVTEWEGDVEYFHIETENHEIILAEGAPAETFIDNVSRKAFYNHAEYEALYPNAKPMIELDIPRVKFARQLPVAIRRRLETNPHVNMVALA